ncbi:hypothetical protein EH223_10420 [candidate division KSB1 bacterium]|nr:hypothetical protein [candidate division KSB1 bacterium]RQW03249.1 MAG: hypothetical protein EH223_10420 [candidate division KSB1 bacterium]
MKYHRISFVVMSLILVLFVFGQQSDDSIVPQKVEAQLQKLEQEIEKKQYSFTVGYNSAHAYQLSELCGLRVPEDWLSTAKANNIQLVQPQMLRAEAVTIPAQWDWREQDGVTAIRDQKSCGSCWAFATLGSFESLLKIKQDTTVDLSEQHLVSCNQWNWGCNGGFWAHDMLINPGAVLEADFSYVAADVACGGPYTYPFKLNGWSYVDGQSEIPGVQAIKEAIYNYGPVCTAVYVGTAFQSYTSGVFDKEEAKSGGFLNCGGQTKSPNHGVMLVGWDDTKNAWILKNSWGTGWGENGYMLIKYETSLIGYAAAVSF